MTVEIAEYIETLLVSAIKDRQIVAVSSNGVTTTDYILYTTFDKSKRYVVYNDYFNVNDIKEIRLSKHIIRIYL